MSNISSRKIKVLFLSVGNFLTSISSLLLAISLTRIFSVNQYADYKQTLLVFNMFAPLLLFGLDKSIYYFFSKTETNKKNDFLNIQWFLLLTNISYILFFILGGDAFISLQFNNPSIKEYLLIYSIISLFEIPTRLLSSILVIGNKVKVLTIFNIVYKLIYFIISVSLAYYLNDVKLVLISQVFLALLAFLFSQFFIIKTIENKTKFHFDVLVIKKYLIIGIPLSAATMIGYLGKNIDKALVSHYLTKSDFAYYVNGAIEVPLIGSITGAILAILLADFSILYNKKDFKEIFRLWEKSIEFTSSLLILIMFLLLFNAEFVISSMYGIEYIKSKEPFMIYLLLIPIRTMVVSSLITITGKTKFILYGALVYFIVNVISSIILIKSIGYIGPAIATVISTYLLVIFYSFVVKRQFNVSFFKVFNFSAQKYYIIAGLLSYLVLFFLKINYFGFYLNLTLKNSIFILIFFTFIFAVKKHTIYFEMINMLKKKK